MIPFLTLGTILFHTGADRRRRGAIKTRMLVAGVCVEHYWFDSTCNVRLIRAAATVAPLANQSVTNAMNARLRLLRPGRCGDYFVARIMNTN